MADDTPVSNAMLREALQWQWISLIADALNLQMEDTPITVYGKDRKVATESMTSDTEWIQQEERLKLLAAD